ncbi:hypothetical protein JTE90_017943 [Oedothorax gibbosus]|uniref:Uncharacterized protein n=1 Tax=Oedothorax gibbosus TaxID=931172 RepID=A0AAV6V9J7_9ARAC|nr:hypothetical protein JTE90_017943 [Oedothorax gibbosus]
MKVASLLRESLTIGTTAIGLDLSHMLIVTTWRIDSRKYTDIYGNPKIAKSNSMILVFKRSRNSTVECNTHTNDYYDDFDNNFYGGLFDICEAAFIAMDL